MKQAGASSLEGALPFAERLRRGYLLRRYKRFFVDVRLGNGQVVVAHCANPGSMKSCLFPQAPVWLSPATSPKRKLAWTLEIIEVNGASIYVNPMRANDVVWAALQAGSIPELSGYPRMRREVQVGSKSRIDFYLESERERCYLEVKTVTLGLGQGRSAFPDSVSQRGSRHLEELIRLRQRGARAVLLFCAARDDTEQVEPADDIDPVYGETLRRAEQSGVELLAYCCDVSPRRVGLVQRVPVVLPKTAPKPPRSGRRTSVGCKTSSSRTRLTRAERSKT